MSYHLEAFCKRARLCGLQGLCGVFAGSFLQGVCTGISGLPVPRAKLLTQPALKVDPLAQVPAESTFGAEVSGTYF